MRKGITTRVEIDLTVIEQNFKALQQYSKPADVIAVLKGDAYGHGAVQVARALQRAGCFRCAIATLDEGLLLRKKGISLDVHLLGAPSRDQMEMALESNLIPMITSPEALTVAEQAASRLKKRARVHIKIDSGMGRFGLMPADMPAIASRIKDLKWVTVEGVCTHLARAMGDPEFSKMQLDAFERAARTLDEAVGHRLLRHALATMGTLLYKDLVSHDFVRLGSLLYGFAHSPIPPEVGVRTALSLKTQLVQVKSIPKGWNLGYGYAVAENDMKVGLVQFGICEGFMSSSVAKAYVLVRGVPCKIKGISADSAIVDLSKAPDAEYGDEVVVVGRQGNAEITAQELGIASGTNYSEILMKMMPRVPRLFIEDGIEVAEQLCYEGGEAQ